MRRRLRIFNVSGIMLNGRVDALADWFRAELSPVLVETFAPIPASRVLDSPADAIARTGDHIDAFLSAAARDDPEAHLIGVGRSFGGYMLLKAVSERASRLDGFSLLLAAEAPLSPAIPVQIPPLLPVLLPAARHYRERPVHAAVMVRALAGRDLSKVLTIGGAVDAVVAPGAHGLPGATRVVWGQHTEKRNALSGREGSLHIELPAFAPGLSLETALLPRSYRTHLTWGDDKHRLVNRIVAAACGLG